MGDESATVLAATLTWLLKGNTLQPLYNMVCYNMVLDITRFKDRSQKCIDYIEKVILQYNLYFFVWI